MFNNDVRLRALRTLAETLAPIEQKKAILYFSAGMERSGQDNQVELRDGDQRRRARATCRSIRSTTRGLQAVVPGGDARQASGRGTSLFSGRGVAQQFARLAASQDTLTSLAADTGGRAFTDTNDFGEAFARVQRDMSAYYLLGYSSTNTAKDGRFRRIQVRVKREGLRVEARAGYYAERDFAHTNRGDREAQLAGAAVRRGLGDRSAGAGHRRLLPPRGRPVLRADRGRRPRLRRPGRRRARTRSRSTCSAWCATSRACPSAASARR